MEYIINPELLPPHLELIFNLIRVLFIIISAGLFVAIIYFIFSTDILEEKYLKDVLEFTKASPYKNVKIPKNWESLKEKSRNEDVSERKLAIVEAGDMIVSVLNEMGHEGDSLKECLSEVGTEIIPNKKELIDVYEKGKDVVYNPEKKLSEEEAGEIMEVYEKTLKDLQLL